MRILVCGGRAYSDREYLEDTLDFLEPTHVITGGAHGADRLANQWAVGHNLPHTIYMADWGRHGSAAGPIRNQHMLEKGKPDLVVAFEGGKGTEDMVKLAKRAGVKVMEVPHNGR